MTVKADGTYDVSVKFAPVIGWNIFHEETYVVAWSRANNQEWLERCLNQHEECEDTSGKLKKAEKYKFVVDGLPHFTPLKFRMCAVSKWGRGPWSKEACVTTMAVPSKDFGFTGALGPAWEKTGSGKSEYRWLQTRNEVHVKIPLGPDTKAKDIKFKALPKKLELGLLVRGEAEPLLNGVLAKTVNPDDVAWYIDESPEDGRHIQITLFKTDALEKWSRVFDGPEHPEIDEHHVQFFTNPLCPTSLGDLYE
eukprot:CAMPEP_0197673558 /NCGR_PEP_ID=MMETSP1338-20131121/81209_1 /TAXON_ID=43686 ORGANISM="Pelagodinium beii, Strain RCC1491" /NCGR_SAMPLE_ID=MMETSP1338 /ASSEMBLY_ACC=CAM_ASM_000754 /LENGTH=250 /DNA_ID=CAMNT_0043253829 /DNA_START=311 /DNA_END=1063 /DNA_ORIENTATION=+